MKEALYYEKLDDQNLRCLLCPHECKLLPTKTGICGVRKNCKGKLITENYRKISALHIDPIEQKPLYHYYPGRTVLSVGSVGCNLHCKFCQNSSISQTTVSTYNRYLETLTVDKLIQAAQNDLGNIGIAYTYNEPTVLFEYMYDSAVQAKKKGLKTVMVTNGYINEKPLEDLLKCIDAFSVDLKAFTEDFYKNQTGSHLEPVKQTLKQIQTAGKHLEIVNLIIPNLNDNESTFTEMIEWIYKELGKNTVLHLSRYSPNYKLTLPPTPIDTLIRLYNIATEYLNHVYLGNVWIESRGRDTLCSNCKKVVVQRNGYISHLSGLNGEGKCDFCGTQILTQ